MFDLYANASGTMNYSDFIAGVVDLKGEVNLDIVKKSYSLIDVEQRGYITR